MVQGIAKFRVRLAVDAMMWWLLAAGLLLGAGVQAHDHAAGVVPEHERASAEASGFDGPRETQGVEAIISLGSVSLRDEFEGIGDRVLRARELVLAPGAVVAVHRHDARPGVAYILEGELVEYRNDASQPLLRKAGAVAFENTGVTHWWQNKSTKQARAIVVDIVPVEGCADCQAK